MGEALGGGFADGGGGDGCEHQATDYVGEVFVSAL